MKLQEWLKLSLVEVFKDVFKGRGLTLDCCLGCLDILNNAKELHKHNEEWAALEEPRKKMILRDILTLMVEEEDLYTKEALSNIQVRDDKAPIGKKKREVFYKWNH